MHSLHPRRPARTWIKDASYVKDAVEPSEDLLEGACVAQVDHDLLDREAIEAQAGRCGAYGTQDLVSACEEVAYDIGADEAGASGDEIAHRWSLPGLAHRGNPVGRPGVRDEA